ncbi:uncharacterized protein LOC111706688 isoform X1 [Eurytemora carolleeae]|uniref:uncharacterized protein LOC111706688 isoform X1 n=1 Tax=Eurytemora carolleeae TaxID=1294199 RepID=UPI000C788930|nr:uncharacterized protein LOC111706688 isoform X1 [Eurytemora carolleeae]|eukprot:XP_023335370.1 uncharacterized protein LOC111706688 isoform X1 [Eurytemora affinis]
MVVTGEEGDDTRVFNQGIISEWFNQREDYGAFLRLVRVGDRLEMKRDKYCHWGIYMGEQILDIDDQLVVLPCIGHRANPTDNPEKMGGFSASFRSMSKGAFGIGDVCLEPLREVWGRSLLRINNSMDNTVTPFPSRIVVERVMKVVNGEDRHSFTAYNVVTNNCEHFASWSRNSWALSHQVYSASEQILKLSMLAVSVLLPRPLAVAGGICITGIQMLKEIRRV